MLLSIDNLRGYEIHGTDGEVGHVASFLFDDTYWNIRYMVVDTGPLIFGKKVLLSPQAVKRLEGKGIGVSLTTDQIKNSPPIDSEKPVSRQMEIELHSYYGWPYYWDTQATYIPAPPMASFPVGTDKKPEVKRASGDAHLRSTREVIGYRVYGQNEIVGHVDDFIVDTGIWRIKYAVINTKKNISGKKVLIGIRWVKEIRWEGSAFVVDIPEDVINSSPEFDPSQPVNRGFEEVLYDYYGFPQYWRRYQNVE